MSEKDEVAIASALNHADDLSNADGNTVEKPTSPEGPTDSHILSQVEPQEKGLAHRAGDTDEVTDLGWNASAEDIQEPLIAGLSNEDLWMLIRRFDKQVYNVKAVPDAPLQNLDLTRFDDDEFSPDKLRATIERFYTTVIVGLTGLVKHIARLRSWKEPRRAAAFCAVYFLAWILDFLAPTFFAALIALVIYPPCRSIMFPPAPIALVDKQTGGVQKPKAGVLGSHDSITGAPEKYKGEAAEQEASNLVSSVASVAVGSAVGKHDQGVPDEDAVMEKNVPDAMDIVSNSADAQSAAHGNVPAESHDKTREPVKDSVMNAANTSMEVINDITDTYEKFGNALSATPPFPRLTLRLRLAAILVPACLLSTIVSSYVLVKSVALLNGFVFFGDPLIWRGIAYLNREYPHWLKLLELQNSLLKGIPTNAQITVTLLRIGEANASPLPPPPNSRAKAPSRPASLHHEELSLGATDAEIQQAAGAQPQNSDPNDPKSSSETSHKKTLGSRLLGFFRGTTATGVEGMQAIDVVRAVGGSRQAKNKLGVLHRKGRMRTPMGPVEFDARYKGKRGAAVIDSSKETPVLYFTTDLPEGDLRLESRKPDSVLFTMPVTEIREMKKLGGMGWKGKLVVGWAMGSKEVVDGLLIVGKDPGQTYQLTAMARRNQLFNRLIAIDGQVWK